MRHHRSIVAAAAVTAGVLAACGDGGSSVDAAGSDEGGRPTIVVTTSILGDVVSNLVGDAAEVVTVMPPGASPHEFQASAQDAAAMREAELLVVNGGGFEEGLLDVVEGAEADGVTVHEAISAVATIELGAGGHGHDEEEGEEEGEEHADEEEGHEPEGVDPHFFTDPARMAAAAEGILDVLVAEVPALDTDAVRATADAYLDELEALDAEVEALVDTIEEDRRILVTNHEVFGYFADRYGFEVVGAVIPATSTSDGSSAEGLAELAETIEREGVPAIFADTSSPADLARTIAEEAGDVEVVELFSESLGEDGSDGATYLDMVRTNAERIVAALS